MMLLMVGRIIYVCKHESTKSVIVKKIINAIFPLLYFLYITAINYLDFGIQKSEGIIFLLFGGNEDFGLCLMLFFSFLVWGTLVFKMYIELNNKVTKNIIIFITLTIYIILFVINIVSRPLNNTNYILLYSPTVLFWIIWGFGSIVKYINSLN